MWGILWFTGFLVPGTWVGSGPILQYIQSNQSRLVLLFGCGSRLCVSLCVWFLSGPEWNHSQNQHLIRHNHHKSSGKHYFSDSRQVVWTLKWMYYKSVRLLKLWILLPVHNPPPAFWGTTLFGFCLTLVHANARITFIDTESLYYQKEQL